MARRHRFHKSNASYHLMLRGNDGQAIFFSEGDKAKLCLFMQQGVERFGHAIEAFCFMSNHIHLAVRVGDISISRIMHHLAFRYTQYVNRKYNRIGHLFQGRFKSVLVEDEDYLRELIRYIHLNPVRAKLVFLPEQYHWSSHRAYMGLDEFCWLKKDRVLRKFSPEPENALNNYEKYVLEGIGVETKFDFKSGCKAGLLGSQEFIDEFVVKISDAQSRKIELTDLIAKICEISGITQEELIMPVKLAKFSQARALLTFFVREIESISLEDLAKFLKRDPSTLTQLVNRFQIKIARDPVAYKKVESLRVWLKQGI